GDSIYPVPRDVLSQAHGATVTLGVRPEDLEPAPAGEGLAIEADVVEELGADAYLYGHTQLHGTRYDVVARADARKPPVKGETSWYHPRPGHVHLFDIATGHRLDD
ncbi:TOBE domain-containing protein, partial [Arthrobacter deserti]|nr:TOBE domain-containing protein [Arthrobacter deserti]